MRKCWCTKFTLPSFLLCCHCSPYLSMVANYFDHARLLFPPSPQSYWFHGGRSHLTQAVASKQFDPIHEYRSLHWLSSVWQAKPSTSSSQPRIHLLLRATDPLSSGSLPEKPTNVRKRAGSWDVTRKSWYPLALLPTVLLLLPHTWSCSSFCAGTGNPNS